MSLPGQEIERWLRDSILFADVLQQKPVLCPAVYRDFLIMDILGIKRKKIRKLPLYEYLSAFNYSLTAFMIRGMIMNEPEKKKHFFNQPQGWDIDPNFVSRFEPGGVKQ